MKCRMIRALRTGTLLSLWTLFMVCCYSCTEEESALKPKELKPYDPSKPVEITDFTPKKGAASTRLYILGSNFGTDVSQISITIGGESARVVGSDGGAIYCIVPPRSAEGTIKVMVSSGDNQTTVVANEKFQYEHKTVVSTLCGYVSPTGDYEVKDGSFDDCGFAGPQWFSFDPKNNRHLYVVEFYSNIRLVDLEKREVSTVMTRGQGHWDRPRTITWTLGGDTMIIANEKGGEHTVANSIAYRRELFKKPYPLMYTDEKCTTSATHPVNGELYYNAFLTGDMYRYDWSTGLSEKLFTIQDREWEYNVVFHPSGDYAYIIVVNRNYILKSEYDWEKRRLKTPTLFCGDVGQSGWVDGTGNSARFNVPQQGTFVRNEDYSGKNDEYDFYVADVFNHCIRKITPEGKVTTYAGRGSRSVNNDVHGFIDGDLREEARFNQPNGIIFDEITRTFYIGDLSNRRIRMIVIE